MRARAGSPMAAAILETAASGADCSNIHTLIVDEVLLSGNRHTCKMCNLATAQMNRREAIQAMAAMGAAMTIGWAISGGQDRPPGEH